MGKEERDERERLAKVIEEGAKLRKEVIEGKRFSNEVRNTNIMIFIPFCHFLYFNNIFQIQLCSSRR